MPTGKMIAKLADELKWSDRRMGEALGVSKQTVSAYRSTKKNANPLPEKIDELATYLESKIGADPAAIRAWIYAGRNVPPPLAPTDYTQPNAGNMGSVKETAVHYNQEVNDNNESESDLLDAARKFASPRIVRLNVPAGKGSEVWSVKGARRVALQAKAWISEEGRYLVVVDGDSLGASNRLVTLGFTPDEYPHQGRFLFCRQRANPDLHSIRYIDPDGAYDVLLSPTPGVDPLPLSEWDVLGYADLVIRPVAGGEPEVDLRPQGIGPDKRRG